MSNYSKPTLRQNQTGLVAIVVTMILMLVISLLTLSFATVVRRDQRQQLDRQLSSRAFYAAESGVNIASKQLTTNPAFSGGTAGCKDGSLFGGVDFNIDNTTATAVTCLSVQTEPTDLVFNDVSNDPRRINIESAAGGFTGLTFNWQSKTAPDPASFPCAANQYKASWNCGAPVLRIDLVNVSGAVSRAALLDNTFTAFLYPSSAGGAVNFTSAIGNNMGATLGGSCNRSNNLDCSVTINAGLGGTRYVARVMSLYDDAQLKIEGTVGGAPARFVGSQAIIDSTAKSQDVLKRIQVRKPLGASSNDGWFIDTALTVGGGAGICKQYTIRPGVVGFEPADGPACNLN